MMGEAETQGRGGGSVPACTTHACARIVKHNMKYSLVLPLDTEFIFVEGKSPRRPGSVKASSQQNTGRLAGKEGTRCEEETGEGAGLPATRMESRGVTGVGEINSEDKRVFA